MKKRRQTNVVYHAFIASQVKSVQTSVTTGCRKLLKEQRSHRHSLYEKL